MLATAIAIDAPQVDALAVFVRDGDELLCAFARGVRAASFERRRLRCDGESLPARALQLRRGVTAVDGRAVLAVDRSAVAVPWSDGGCVYAVAYAASIYSGVRLESLLAALRIASQPFVAARDREETRREADVDDLTGLLTSRAFRRRLDVEFQTVALRRPQPSICLWFVDADGFKDVNDRFGHRAGDDVLRTLASLVLAQTVDGFDVAGRNGGDEFCLLARSSGKTRAIERARALCRAAQRHAFALSGVTVSVGVAAFPHDAASATELLDAADRAMYHSKRTGRNRVSYAVERGSLTSIQPEAVPVVPRTLRRWDERSGESFSERSLR